MSIWENLSDGSRLIFFAIPYFIISMVLECAAGRKKLPKNYTLKDTAASLSMGIGNVVLSVLFTGAMTLTIFAFVYNHGLKISFTGWFGYLFLFIIEDFCYYWFHRYSHVSRFFWNSHEVHHSSNHYNLSTALRQTWSGLFFGWVFWLPLAALGFTPEQILFQQAVSLVYQFGIHTRVVRFLPAPIEWIFNTPSHHRVHHAVEVPYLDKNFGGILIIWDRLFGTFTQETLEPTYGVLHPLESHNPLIIGTHTWPAFWKDVMDAPGFLPKIKTLFAPPGWKWDGTGTTVPLMQAQWEAERQSQAPSPQSA